MESNVQVTLSPEIYIAQIQNLQKELLKKEISIHDLEVKLAYEIERRGELEDKLSQLSKDTDQPKKKASKKREVTPLTNTYSDFKSDGKRKPHSADPIRSYSDFKAIQDYFWNKGEVRNWMMWTVGVSMGLRVSDLLSLRFGHFFDIDKKSLKARVQIYEKKTGKLHDLLITEAVQQAILIYSRHIQYDFDLEDFLFASKKTGKKMYEEHGWRILSSAGKALNLPIVIGSHTMRKSFANIAACVDKSCIDMNSITKIQGLLNHSDQRVTMKYLGTYQDMYDRARVAVSDFVLGRTGVDEIIAGNQHTVDDVMERLDALEKICLKGE